MPLPEALGEAHAAGHGFVEVDGGCPVVRRADLGDQAQVARVHHEKDARDGLQRPTGARQRDVELRPAPADRRLLGRQPVGRRLELDLGEMDRPPAEVLVRDELQLLEERRPARDHDLAMTP